MLSFNTCANIKKTKPHVSNGIYVHFKIAVDRAKFLDIISEAPLNPQEINVLFFYFFSKKYIYITGMSMMKSLNCFVTIFSVTMMYMHICIMQLVVAVLCTYINIKNNTNNETNNDTNKTATKLLATSPLVDNLLNPIDAIIIVILISLEMPSLWTMCLHLWPCLPLVCGFCSTDSIQTKWATCRYCNPNTGSHMAIVFDVKCKIIDLNPICIMALTVAAMTMLYMIVNVLPW